MDHELLRRIVQVEASFKESAKYKAGIQRGTGFRLGPGQVLTAQHVIERGSRAAIERASEIRIRLDEDGSGEHVIGSPATVAWVGESKLDPSDHKALDAALLVDELPTDGLESFRDWVHLPRGKSSTWETEGFAAASSDAREMGTEYLWGVCHPARQQATYLKLTVDRNSPVSTKKAPGSWGGVSGGPVFIKDGRFQGHLYGIVRSSPREFPDALYAVGTPALLRDVELRSLLGIEEPMPPHVSLVEKLRTVLEEDASLTEQLASLNDAWRQRWEEADTDGLVDVLCAEDGLRSMLERLRGLSRNVDPKSAKGARLRGLSLVLVSILASRELPGGAELTAESTRRIQLGTASPNFAEALLASAFGTPCLYEKSVGVDLPRAWLRVPTATMEAGIRAQHQVDEQLEELLVLLMEKELDDPRFLLPAQKALFNTLPPRDKRDLLRVQLEKNLSRLEERHGRRAYLAADGELQKKMGNQLKSFLDRLSRVLPNLDLVELETGMESVARAIEQEDELWPLWEILDLLPDVRSPR